MYRILIFLFVISSSLNAQNIQSQELINLESKLELVAEYAEKDQLHLISPYLINGLKQEQITWIQKFASQDFSNEQKQASLPFYKKLNAALALLGESSIDYIDTPTETLSGNPTGIIRGVVRSAVTGTPLSQAYVYRYDQNGTYVGYKQTDTVGRYVFQNIDNGTYYLSAQKGSQYNTQFYSGVSCPGGLGAGCQLNELTAIQIDTGQIVEQIDFNLELNGIITGSLKDASSNQNISGTISVYDSSFDFVDSYSTAYSTGNFSLYLPDNGDYYLTFASNGYVTKIYDNVSCPLNNCNFSLGTAVNVAHNTTLSMGNIELEKYHTISGRTVRLPDLEPINSYVARVEILDTTNNSILGIAYVNNDGYWVSDPLIPGSYYVRNNASGYIAQYYRYSDCDSNNYSSCNSSNFTTVNHTANQDTQNINFRLRPGGTIKGTVFDSQSEPTYATVHIYDETGSYFDQMSTYNDGTFEFTGLSNGIYYISGNNSAHLSTLHSSTLCSQQNNYATTQCNSATEGIPITVSNYNTRTKNIHLKVGATVSGIIRDSNNLPIPNANVELVSSENNYTYKSTLSDSSGNYVISNIKPGSYFVTAEAYKYATVLFPSHTCNSQSGCNYNLGTTINVSGSNSYNNYNINLPQLGNIKFNLKNTANQPVTNGRVIIHNSSDNYIGYQYPNDQGTVDIYLSPGTYYFQYLSDYYDNQYISKVYGSNNCYQNCTPSSGTPITTNYSQVSNYSMTLDKVFSLTGSIVSDFEVGNNWKYIKIYQNNNLISSKKIHYSNEFDIPLNLTGTIKVEAFQEGYYSQYFNGIDCNGDGCGLPQASTINVVPNQTRNINFNLSIMSHIKGRVRAPGGSGISNIQVTFANNNYNSRSTYTDNNGYYEIYGLTPGDYNILARTDGQYESTLYGNIPCPSPCDYDPSHTVNIAAGVFLNNRNINMQERGQIEVSNLRYMNNDIASDVDVEFINQASNNVTARVESDSLGNTGSVYLPQGTYKLRAVAGSYSTQLITAYPDIDCSVVGNSSCISQSPAFTVNVSGNININDFKVNQRGRIFAEVRSAEDNSPISDVVVQIYDSNYELIQQKQSQNGEANITGLLQGQYYAFAKTSNNDDYLGELYNEVDCARGIGFDCIFSQGSSFSVSNNSTENILFTLAEKPNLTVNLVNSYTQDPVFGTVNIYSSTGNQITAFSNQSTGVMPLFAGQYYAVGSASNYNTIAYPDGICGSYYDLDSCALGNAELIVVDGSDSVINIELDLINGVNGSITNAYTGEPIVGAAVDFWTNVSYYNTSTYTNNQGRFSKSLNQYYDYWVSTDVPMNLGLYNQVFNNIRCFDGPAVLNLCDVSQGMKIDFNQQNTIPNVIEFNLDGDPVFSDSFE
jgi:protocatechuate 3,4-dioxygenase beta subunit